MPSNKPSERLSDAEIRARLKKAEGIAAELTTVMRELTDILDQRDALAASKSTPGVDLPRPSDGRGFLLPKSLSGNFNAKGKVVAVQALPNYLKFDVKPQELADFRFVLAGLVQRGNRDSLFPMELADYLPNEPFGTRQAEQELRTLDIIRGKSANGFNIVILAASTEDDKTGYLYVVEDKLRQKMVVAGPEKISPSLKSELAKNGVSYVVRKDDECNTAINDLIAEGVKHRIDQNLAIPGHTQSIVEGLVRGCAALCDIQHAEQPVGGWTTGNTLGQMIRRSGAPAVYTSIMRPAQV